MKVGDLVHDSSLGLNGVIFDVIYEAATNKIPNGLRRWTVLYEDGDTDEAYDNELEVISDNR
ncbi:MAG TPA: hypothetical protein EYG55_09760 [Gemmatimonadetes bacterium]|nr:hypothetical protein [Gemmatimonadota bacterium]